MRYRRVDPTLPPRFPITGSAVYRHFSSKDEVLAALVDRLLDALLIRIGEPIDSPPEADFEGLIAAHVEFSIDNPEHATNWNREQATLSQVYRANITRR
ncbi:TetR/AcrR family transcriptional regulator [Rhodococcus sp. NPDC056960]|uniref:TetR/AcrR family transcriptional regulator n=1 Tax=Rhodococcus sp. NPDC056960 TaxID=3345982 RepID=UPI003631180D